MKTRRRFSGAEREDLLAKSQQCLWKREGVVGLEYLRDKRRLSEECIRRFDLGYVPHFVKHQLAGRIIFPIYDPSKNLVALGSRLIVGDSSLPTYWHESYEKDFYLYGTHVAKDSMMKWEFATVVEGQFDAMKLHTVGITNCVALCGTKFSDMQLATIYRYCEEVIVILDTDENRSGQRASEKIEEKIKVAACMGDSLYPYDLKSKITTLMFKENLDPDEFVDRYGASSLKSLIKAKLRELRNRGY